MQPRLALSVFLVSLSDVRAQVDQTRIQHLWFREHKMDGECTLSEIAYQIERLLRIQRERGISEVTDQ
jgi:hypothetical protein